MSGHTPGPWIVNGSAIESNDSNGRCIRSGAHVVAWICDDRDDSALPWEANARLIAAAPEMADVLREATKLCMLIGDGENKYSGYATQIYGYARALLAKIEGERP